ncbi:unnamed protein product [Effrenium voratum]|uniref:EF-hand domain-containing protein n=1 Tax=Effrenium voratum TaxID=2562239 RepID=A0AA36JE38_9DINO|nr:unnamed protein product [Effrenium voratum]
MESQATFDQVVRKSLHRGPTEEAEHNEHLEETLQTIKSLRYRSYTRKPWMDEQGRVTWSIARIRVAQVVISQSFETCMGLIILTNLGLIIYEADQDAKCYPAYSDNYNACPERSDNISWLSNVNLSLLVVYSIECLARWFVERGGFFCNRWNQIDLTTVILGWISAMLTGMMTLSFLRLCRVVRILRAARVLISIPEFYLLITGLYSSVKAIIFGSFMLATVILFWAIIVVQLLHPVNASLNYDNCEDCAEGYSSVWAAAVTLFQQIVAGDSWGAISVPVVQAAPWTAPLLFFILITISLGVMNLILAVIVERAAEAHDNDQDQKIKQKEEERSRSMLELAKQCSSMDDNENGALSLEEMLKGYDKVESFKTLMRHMDIRREDMKTIFQVLDKDNAGEVSHFQFCQHVGSFSKRDPVIMHSIVKYTVLELRKLIEQEEQRELLNPKPCLAKASEAPFPGSLLRSLECSFQALELQMKPLLERSEAELKGVQEMRKELPGHDSDTPKPVSKLPPKDRNESDFSGQRLDTHFAKMCEDFQKRLAEVEELQRRCRSMVDCLTRLRDEEVILCSEAV